MPIRLHSRVVLPNGLHGSVILVVAPFCNPIRELARVGITKNLNGIKRDGHGNVTLRDHVSFVVCFDDKKKDRTVWPPVRNIREE